MAEFEFKMHSDYTILENKVRWFYKYSTDKYWRPFKGYDSLNLETQFRCLNNVPPCNIKSSASECTTVIVRGGMYEANLVLRKCEPIYWTHSKCDLSILRGTWFRDMGRGHFEPLEDEAMINRLEQEYIIQSSKFDSEHLNSDKASNCAKVHRPLISSRFLNECGTPPRSVTSYPNLFWKTDSLQDLTSSVLQTPPHVTYFPDCYVEWFDPDHCFLHYRSSTSYIKRKLGFERGTRLCRGYHKTACRDEKSAEIVHLCFVIHGIGHKMSEDSIFRNSTTFRRTCTRLMPKYFPELTAQNKRVEFLPVEWRSSLELDDDTVRSITITHVSGLRKILNSSAMDIMYYTSPLYHAEIISSLHSELNRLYTIFCRQNPTFESNGGRVSLIGHSLGCVLAYDLITGWSRPLQPGLDNLQTGFSATNGIDSGLRLCKGNSDTFSSDAAAEFHNLNNEAGRTVAAKEDSNLSSSMLSSNVSFDYISNNLEEEVRLNSLLEDAHMVVKRLEQRLVDLRRGIETSTRAISNDSGMINDSFRENNHFTQTSGSPLLFRKVLKNLFCFGSPLGVFLTLRGIRPGSYVNQDNILPRTVCPRIFNIYHPVDAVAYRLEPLVLKRYTHVKPVRLKRCSNLSAPPATDYYDRLPLIPKEVGVKDHMDDSAMAVSAVGVLDETYGKDHSRQNRSSHRSSIDFSNLSRSSIGSNTISHSEPMKSIKSRLFGFLSNSTPNINTMTNNCEKSVSRDRTPSCLELSGEFVPFTRGSMADFSDAINDPSNFDADSTSSVTLTHNDYQYANGEEQETGMEASLLLDHRLDFQIKPTYFGGGYMSILTAHFSYWSNQDVALFILSQLFNSDDELKVT